MALRGSVLGAAAIRAWRRALGWARKAARNLRRPGRRWSAEFSELAEERFRREGPGWKPLAPSTIATRVRKGFGPGPILQRTGRLRASVVSASHPESIERIESDQWERGTRVPYGVFLYGDRPFLPDEGEAVQRGAEIVVRHMEDAL